jgi:hypothetical protein
MTVIVGKGLFQAVALKELPQVGAELNLRSIFTNGPSGHFRVTEVATIQWGEKDYPHILIDRLGEIPQGEESLPMALLSI